MAQKGKATQEDLIIGQNLKKHRLENGMSQKELARNIGLSFQQIQKYETGKNRISASILGEVSNILQVPIGRFYEATKYCDEHDIEIEEKINYYLKDIDDSQLIKLLKIMLNNMRG